jgi:serine/threonine protein kinase
MRNSSDLVGKTLGTCTLEKLIGQGGMGAVYLARQARPARNVAVKVLLPNVRMGSKEYQAFLIRFRREADVIARLEHINIMPIYEYGEQEGFAYLVMPYLTGGSLRDLLAHRGSLSFFETATYLDQASSALAYAHAHGVIHRDIKPNNLLIHNDGRLVLADFGIARIMQETGKTVDSTLTSPSIFMGTPNYMAPEMAQGGSIDNRVDIYELGIVLFHMLSGRVPFTGDSPLVIAFKHLQEPLPRLHDTNPSIPPAVDTVIQRATAKRPEDRFESALDLASAFRSAITPPNSPQNYAMPPRQYGIQTAPEPPILEPVRPLNSATGAVVASQNYPDTPQDIDSNAPTHARRPWLLLIVLLLVLALITGGIFVIKGAFATQQPPATPTPTATSTHTATPTSTATSTPTATPTPTLAQQSTIVLQHFYDDINNKDYQAAYSLLGSQFQSSQPYNQFASGYAHTEHDNLTTGNVTALSDGTFKVPATIVATEDNVPGPGTHQSTYQGYYIVGQENGTLKILSGQFTKVA